MTEGVLAFILWVAVSSIFIIIGIYDLRADKVVGFWSNGKRPEVEKEKVKDYNRAVGRLWIAFAIAYILLGIPLLAGDNSPYIVITLLGSLAGVIVLMAVYVLVIERKYCKK